MERFTRIIGLAVIVAATITALFGLFVQQYDAVEMVLFAVALAVSAIPEGLPVGITVALGVASRRIAKVGVPEAGVSAKRKYRRLYELINTYHDSVIFILDEIDLLVGRRASDEPAYSKLRYQLSRASNTNEIEGRVSVAALTSDPKFIEDIDGRAESSFDLRDVYSPDYDANQLREILRSRRDAFRPAALFIISL